MEFTVVLSEGLSGYIVANVPQLPGCHTQGRDRAEALRNVREAIQLYLSIQGPAPGISIERVSVEG